MKWYDPADDIKRLNATLPPQRQEPFVEGVSYRVDDGTPRGRWVVAIEAQGSTRWVVWDLRRGTPERPAAVRVVGGFTSPQVAIMAAELLAAVRPLRVVAASARAAANLVSVVTFPIRAVASTCVTAVRAVAEEWRLP
jgi:hypothetical protein